MLCRYPQYLVRGTCLIHSSSVVIVTESYIRPLVCMDASEVCSLSKQIVFIPDMLPPHPPHLPESLGSFLLPLCLNNFIPFIHSAACSAILPTFLLKTCCVCLACATAEAQLPARATPRATPYPTRPRTLGTLFQVLCEFTRFLVCFLFSSPICFSQEAHASESVWRLRFTKCSLPQGPLLPAVPIREGMREEPPHSWAWACSPAPRPPSWKQTS